jgi:acetylornithine deacetylase/succinyl-diaminopimelate desuccinylase-like protein
VTAEPITVTLNDEQRDLYRRVVAQIDADRLQELAVELTDIPSATGEEGTLAAHIAARGRRHGLDAEYQPIDENQGNALLRYGTPDRDGPNLLLYAPIDTHTSGTSRDDLPWAAAELRSDMLPTAKVTGDYVSGLGANNPKGHAACVIAAVEAAARAGIPLTGSVTAGLGAGGMPTNAPPDAQSMRQDIGHGRGVAFMLDKGIRADFAVIAKTNWAVSWEEVGLAWFRIRVHGAMNYTGIRHFVAYDNPIAHAATLIGELDSWFAEYTARHTSGLVAPQGSIGAIQGGWPYKPTFSPAACDLFVDLRLSPRTSVGTAQRELSDAVARIADKHGFRATIEPMLAIPGSHTDPDSWIVRSCIRAWEELEGEPHQPRRNQSGATDANVLRRHGIPTARIGLARVPDDAPFPNDFSKGMNVVSIPTMVQLTQHLAYVIVDTCTRSAAEVGLRLADDME